MFFERWLRVHLTEESFVSTTSNSLSGLVGPSSLLPSPAEGANRNIVLQKRVDGPTRTKPSPQTPRKRRVPTAGDQSDSDSEHDQGRTRDPSYTPGSEATSGKTSKNRDEKEMKKCIARDHGACLLTGTASPEACHIIPFAVNSTEEEQARLLEARNAFDLIPGSEPVRRYKLLTVHLGCSDKAWNMLSLNRQLHKWWSEMYFAIKCLGIAPSQSQEGAVTIRLQFQWMPLRNTTQHWKRPIDLKGGEALHMVQEWKARRRYGMAEDLLPSGGVAAAAEAAAPFWPLQTGRVFELHMSLEEAENMKTMVDLQWACIQIASMSGAADWDDFFDRPEDDPHEAAFQVCVDLWIERLQKAPVGGGTGVDRD